MKSLFRAGKSVADRRPKGAGERRQVTVMFYDIIGSTTMMQQLGDEEAYAAMSDVHNLARSVIEENLGSLEQVMGDGGMAYFGFRHVLEDSAQRAVDTACQLLEARAEAPEGLNIRVGVSTGAVVLPSDSTARLDTNLGAVGVAPNMAARLEAAAQPNTCLVSDVTYRLTRRAYEFDRVSDLSLKGFPDVTGAWQLTGRKQAETRFEQSRMTQTELVGRKQERDWLSAGWAATCAGRGGAVLYVGEPGVGKSRLVRQALVEQAEARRIVLQCQPSTSGEALFAFILMFERAYTYPDRDPALADAAVTAADLMAEIEDNETLTPEARRSAIVNGLVEILIGLSRDCPCLVVAEDLHWVDEVSLAVLVALSKAAESERIAILSTARPDSNLDALGALAEPRRLGALSDDETKALIHAVSDTELRPETVDWITEKSDGNPLFVTELVAFTNDLLLEGKTDPSNLSSIAVDSLRDLLAARLDTAGMAKRTAKIASVIGRDFPFPLLLRLAEEQISTDDLEADLDRLLQHGINEFVVNGDTYSFRHALIRDEAYDSQLRVVRRGLHGRIVDLVAASPELAVGIPDEVMAEHCLLADRLDAGIDALIVAAERALRRSARTAPRRMLERALTLVADVQDTSHQSILTLRAIALLGPLVSLMDSNKAAAPLYQRGRDLCLSLPEGERGPWFPILWGWWFTSPSMPEFARRSQVLVSEISEAEEPEARLQALHCSWATLFDDGNHTCSLHAVEDGLALYDPVAAERSRYLYGHDAKVCGLGERAQSLWMQGDLAGSANAIRAAESWADEIAHVPSQLHALDMALLTASFRKDFGEMQRLLERVAAVSGGEKTPVIQAKQSIFHGWMQARAGDARGAHAVWAGLASLRAQNALEDTPIYADIAANVAQLTGLQDTTLRTLEEEIATCYEDQLTFWLPELLRRKALILQDLGQTRAIEATLDEGLAVAHRQEAHMLVVRNGLSRLGLGLVPTGSVRDSLVHSTERLADGPEIARMRRALGL